METISTRLTYRDVARLGRVCGRLDASCDSDGCALAMIETPLWRDWPERTRRLWELAYHQAQLELVGGAHPE